VGSDGKPLAERAWRAVEAVGSLRTGLRRYRRPDAARVALVRTSASGRVHPGWS